MLFWIFVINRCVVVLYNPKKGKQSHVFNTSKKTLTCLAYSRDGKYLVTGEVGQQHFEKHFIFFTLYKKIKSDNLLNFVVN